MAGNVLFELIFGLVRDGCVTVGGVSKYSFVTRTNQSDYLSRDCWLVVVATVVVVKVLLLVVSLLAGFVSVAGGVGVGWFCFCCWWCRCWLDLLLDLFLLLVLSVLDGWGRWWGWEGGREERRRRKAFFLFGCYLIVICSRYKRAHATSSYGA